MLEGASWGKAVDSRGALNHTAAAEDPKYSSTEASCRTSIIMFIIRGQGWRKRQTFCHTFSTASVITVQLKLFFVV